jgi:DNA polymerase III epsilon subunit-like protein
MKVLVFDTETNGLPSKEVIRKKYPSSSDLVYEYPVVVQLSYILYDLSANEICIIKDDIINISKQIQLNEDSVKIHGITEDIINKKGIDIKESIKWFIEAMNKADILVAHNIHFDKNVLKGEMLRNGFKDYFSLLKRKEICTMKQSINFCKIECVSERTGKTYFKWPKLIQLHNKIFEIDPKNLHNALNDVLICLRCFVYLTLHYDICSENKDINNLIKKLF